jgi:hypothetical protein
MEDAREFSAQHVAPVAPGEGRTDHVYVVFGSTGEYSDHQEWPVVAYTDEERAKDHVLRADEWSRVHRDAWKNTPFHAYPVPKELVGEFQADHIGTNFYYLSVPLSPAPKLGSEVWEHPWQAFLTARMHAIGRLREDGADYAQIAKTLSMDPVQVQLIDAHRLAAAQG